MSVYTKVNPAQLEDFLTRYSLGKHHALTPIKAGVTNSNYYLDCDAGRFILTLYEQHQKDDLDYILGLQQHLSLASVPCAHPVIDHKGTYYSILNQRPAAIIHRLDGDIVDSATLNQCDSIAVALAQFHRAGKSYTPDRVNTRGAQWLLSACSNLESQLDAEDIRLIQDCLRDYQQTNLGDLPRGAIHADLFRDNALFVGEKLSGIIDFDYACHDSFIFDLAVLLNDWCVDHRGELMTNSVSTVLAAYQTVRSITHSEWRVLPLMLRLAALRFWISRLYDKTFSLSGELITSKSPSRFRRQLLLRNRRQEEIRNFSKL